MRLLPSRPHWLAIILATWGVLVTCGWVYLSAYANTPGPAARAPRMWPATHMSRGAGRHTLVVFLHPFCPCSRATVAELEKLSARLRGRLAIRVAVYRPSTGGPEWTDTDMSRLAAAVPDADVHDDPDAREARAFGARVSGQTQLYDPSGQLVFSGGITQMRGHEGDNDGAQAIAEAVIHGAAPIARTPVFGCFLYEAHADNRLALPRTGTT